MRDRIIICLVCLCCQLVAPAKDARSQPEKSPEKNSDRAAQATKANVDRLIEQLSSSRFADRERATEQLILLGLPAVSQLQESKASDNREVRQRSLLVLSVVHELDFQHRLEDFEEDPTGEDSYGLPGWERFNKLAGNTVDSRKLFIQMQRAERELLSAESQTADAAADILQKRCQRLRYSVQIFGTKHELPPIVAALFVATNQDIPLNNSTNLSLMNLCQQVAFGKGIASDQHRSTLKKLLAAWILREDATPAHELMLLALQHNISQVIPRARVLAKQRPNADRPGNIDLYDRHFAVLCLAKFGGDDDVARLEEIMSDDSVIAGYRLNNMTYKVEMRDVALAALLTLTKKEPAMFGYGRLRLQEPFVFDTQTLGFVNDEDRQVAISKWRIFRMR